MHLTIEHAQARVPVTILSLHGALDASNYRDVIAAARELIQAGTRDLLLDLGDVQFLASSGLIALHSIALLLRGEEPPDLDAGWEAFHSMERERNIGKQTHLKLLNPQPKVQKMFQLTRMDDFFEIHTDLQTAIDSF